MSQTLEEINNEYMEQIGEENWDPIEFIEYFDRTFEKPIKKN